MNRVYNFSAGPSMLPEEVLKIAAAEMLDCNGTGQSVMEMSHRSKAFEPIIAKTEALLRELMNIPANYKVLFLQGGASLQFAMIPLNLKKKGKAAYIDTGVWSGKALKEAKRWLTVDVVASSKDKNYTYVPKVAKVEGDYDYVHVTSNNTIFGTKMNKFPETGNIPLVVDASSNILSEQMDVSKFGIIYAGAQKNLAPAGVTVVIVREDLIRGPEHKDGDLDATVPTMLRYDTHANEGSMFNTPPCYSIYIMGLVLEHVKKMGGVDAMAKLNNEKAKILYDFLDNSKYFKATTAKEDRSIMNIPFVTTVEDKEKADAINKKFVSEAAKAGLVNLAGHRLVGGMRASIYNAMPIDGVKALVEFMKKFEKENA
ncbi:MAG TPA: 3-phosphoserine/phosphohydroxythreonine transaminase [Treponemataceae bacterium]|nr:3-phosphoserine/phosphohydroxythreonine transaminase [Treponemataceae bacterium]